MNDLLLNLGKLHTTALGAERIRNNVGLATDDVVAWCAEKIKNADSILRQGKNFYVRTGVISITVNAHSYTLITAHREKPRKGETMDGVGIIRKMDDIPALKAKLIAAFEEKSHKQISRYGLWLAEHILTLTHTLRDPAIDACFEVNQRWQAGQAKFQEARDVADVLLRLAAAEKDPVRVKVLRVIAQVAAIPHVKRHALIASDYAVTLINLLYPQDMDAVRQEREAQIQGMAVEERPPVATKGNASPRWAAPQGAK